MDYLQLTKEEVDNLDEDVAADLIERLNAARRETGSTIGKLFQGRLG